MEEKNKQLLLIDLCARLSYGVIILDTIVKHYGELLRIDIPSLTCFYDGEENEECQTLYNIKPYLRQMSSMTKEEWFKYKSTLGHLYDCYGNDEDYRTLKSFDFLNAHHIDYRGLIKKGLALEATKNMYK